MRRDAAVTLARRTASKATNALPFVEMSSVSLIQPFVHQAVFSVAAQDPVLELVHHAEKGTAVSFSTRQMAKLHSFSPACCCRDIAPACCRRTLPPLQSTGRAEADCN
mmetsp:Transcript_156816/g.285328  ORF Transcript_156816/g.285328 Transcript_156816/m.285328 type:complete len:108 (+) Transcript_156816:1600-1923(+)